MLHPPDETRETPVTTELDGVIPASNEQHTLAACVERRHAHLVDTRVGWLSPSTGALGTVLAFASIGVASSVLHLGLFALLRGGLSAQAANGLALVVATAGNTAANRRWTFGVRGRAGALRHQAQGFLVFALTLCLTSAGLALLSRITPGAPTWLETVAVAVATAVSTVVKFVLMRSWMFRDRPGSGAARPAVDIVPGAHA
jgi:putative flippase GtrA